MSAELSELKQTLRALMVSSPVSMDARALLRDYRAMEGRALPVSHFGYSCPVRFLRQECQDCFLFQGREENPTLTLIVPKQLKHIDDFVQKQRLSSNLKYKVKRRSVQAPNLQYEAPTRVQNNKYEAPSHTQNSKHVAPNQTQNSKYEEQNKTQSSNYEAPNQTPSSKYEALNEISNTKHEAPRDRQYSKYETTARRQSSQHEAPNRGPTYECDTPSHRFDKRNDMAEHEPAANGYEENDQHGELAEDEAASQHYTSKYDLIHDGDTSQYEPARQTSATRILERYKARQTTPDRGEAGGVRRRLQALAASSKDELTPDRGEAGGVRRRLEALAASSTTSVCSKLSSGSREALELVRTAVRALVAAAGPGGLCCDELPQLYRRRYHEELNIGRYGYTSIGAFVLAMGGLSVSPAPKGGLLLRGHQHAAATPAARHSLTAPAAPLAAPLVEDALPGIEYEPEVFPVDCMHYMQSIPRLGTAGAAPGDQLEARVAEVYGPSHFWLQLLGPDHHIAMEELMDDMARYYTAGEGAQRRLAPAAVRVGHHCAALFDRDWHRALIVRQLDQHTVKVRHVDYGTVDTVPCGALKPLLARYGALPAQAVRARLAAVRPPAAARRWPPAAAAAFLSHVRDKHFVASVVAVDQQEEVLTVVLVDTSTAVDVRVDEQLVRAGHADSAQGVVERPPHELPLFSAIESGDTPNYAEIHKYLRDGIALDCVEEFARHVPPLLPPRPARPPAAAVRPLTPESPQPDSPGGGVELVNRVPLFPERAPAGASDGGGGGGGRLLTPQGEVSLSLAECQIYSLLLRMDPAAAHWYMVDAIRRAYPPARPTAPHAPHAPATSTFNPLAPEFHMPPGLEPPLQMQNWGFI